MLNFLVSLLLGLSVVLGVKDTPSGPTDWVIEKTWSKNENGVWTAQFKIPSQKLKMSTNQDLAFPMIIHGAYEIYVDGKLVEIFNDPTMKTVRSFYGRPSIGQELLSGETLTWVVYSNTKYFARISYWPKLEERNSDANFSGETANIAAFGALFLLALYLFAGITQNLLSDLTIALATLSLGLSFYFAMSVPGLFGFKLNMVTAHRIADFNLLIATVGFVKYLSLEKLLPKWFCRMHYGAAALAIIIISIGDSGDKIQVGTTIPLCTLLFAVFLAMSKRIQLIFLSRNYFAAQPLLDFAGLSLFCWAIAHDVLCVMGVSGTILVLPLGVVGGCYSFATAIHSWTGEIHRERDHLRENLESEVKSKTSEIALRNSELEENLSKLRVAQAELVQSAKLASLGTLAAGIAHEINNSINFVNGALTPLEALVHKNMPEGAAREKTDSLMEVMKDGVNWTVNVVKSLRLYTGLNQAQLKEVKVLDLVNAVVAILNSRLRSKIEVKISIPESLTIFGNMVGINQILMNLVTNSLDAMKDSEHGVLEITAVEKEENILISVKDNGSGIDEIAQKKIFDPFFTTKEVGQGTGLGLHIAKQEVDRHQGKLTFSTAKDQGTTFFVELPHRRAA